MLLLDYHNVLLESILTERFSGAPPQSIDQVISDFDGVQLHVSTPSAKTKILISLSMRCYNDLVQFGAVEVLQREYGQYITDVEEGYNFSILIDLEDLPVEKEQKDELIRRISLIKRNAMGAPFERAFQEHYTLAEAHRSPEDAPQASTSEVMTIRYREDESIYITSSHDHVTVIFSTVFKDETDKIFGKVFLQEFVDARRRAIQNAPQVMFRQDPPLELQGVKGVGTGDVGYVTFVLFPRHLTPNKRENTISHIQTFRDYFHYHIKAAKAYTHSRMRKRTEDFLKNLNRAKPENADKERKTASGRSFRVQG